MDFQHLSPLELRDLINKYTSELRVLQFQAVKTKGMIEELQGYLAKTEDVLSLELPEVPAAPTRKKAAKQEGGKKATPSKTRRGRPPGTKNKSTEKKTDSASAGKAKTKRKKPGRPPGSKNKTTAKKEKASKPKESKKTKAPSKKDTPGYRLSEWDTFILNNLESGQKVLTTSDLTEIGVTDPSVKMGAAQIKTRLNASLHKLANKKGLLAKVEHSGRGFAYALQEWVSESGELPSKYVSGKK